MSFKTALTDDLTSIEPEFLREGDAVAFVIEVEGVVSSISSPTMTMYKEGSQTDVSSTYFSGLMSISGVDTIITKTTSSLKAGNWIVSVFATVDGQVQNVCTIPIIVKRKSER